MIEKENAHEFLRAEAISLDSNGAKSDHGWKGITFEIFPLIWSDDLNIFSGQRKTDCSHQGVLLHFERFASLRQEEKNDGEGKGERRKRDDPNYGRPLIVFQSETITS